MGHLQDIRRQSQDSWYTASYVEADKDYDVAFLSTYCEDLRFEITELVRVEHAGAAVPETAPIWGRIREKIPELSAEIDAAAAAR